MRVFAASMLTLGILAMGVGDADAHSRTVKKGYKYGHHGYAAKKVRPQVRGYYARVGGHRYGYVPDARNDQEVVLPSYPRFDDRTMWERVNSDPRSNSNEVGPSGF